MIICQLNILIPINVAVKTSRNLTKTCLLLWKYAIVVRQAVICTTPSPREPRALAWAPVASIQKTFGSSGRDWKPWKKLPIPCKFCTYRFIRYSSTCYGKVRINPLMANTRNLDFFASPVANAALFVVVQPCYVNRDLLSGPKGN